MALQGPQGLLWVQNHFPLPQPHVPRSPLALVVGFMSSFIIVGECVCRVQLGLITDQGVSGSWRALHRHCDALLMISLRTFSVYI